jgi:hypothetical protein
MATVRMSKTLVDQIIKNFKEQCATAYADNNEVGDFVDDIYASLHPANFVDIIDSWCQYREVVEQFAIANGLKAGWGGQIQKPDLPFDTTKKVYFIVNTMRPDSQNRTQLDTWALETYDRSPIADREYYAAQNFVEGDQLITIDTIDMSFPSMFAEKTKETIKSRNKESSQAFPFMYAPDKDHVYGLHADFADKTVKINYPIVISTQEDAQRFETVAAGTFKTKKAVEDMENYLSKLRTLKQFIDNWPGAENLVPNQYMQRHAEKTVRAKPAAEQIPDLPDELKSDVNAAILENKLVGDL